MENKKFKCAIFDLDGVIVNTVPVHFKAWKKMFGEYGKKFTFTDYLNKVDGIPRLDGTRAILKGLPEKQILEANEKKQVYFLNFLSKVKIPVFKSTVRLIKQLKKNNIKLAVVSSSKNCKDILRQTKLINLFEVCLTGNDITKGKPNPQIFITAARQIGIPPKNCVVFEDAILGVEAAKRAKMKCVGIDRQNKPERLKKADIVVKDLREVSIKTLEKLF
ncbi:MAG: beta-phosphoglucomutase family hydrolase [Elusimicrobia bacterium]|nr:beta-phosphoglucomutase family hydrolase [Elusimicrobiota bacterium]